MLPDRLSSFDHLSSFRYADLDGRRRVYRLRRRRAIGQLGLLSDDVAEHRAVILDIQVCLLENPMTRSREIFHVRDHVAQGRARRVSDVWGVLSGAADTASPTARSSLTSSRWNIRMCRNWRSESSLRSRA